jgi:integrase
VACSTRTPLTKDVPRPRARRSLARPADGETLARALSDADGRQRCWIELAAYQGLRCKEIAYLRREDVFDREQMLRVVHGKGEHQRLLPPHAAFDPATTRPAIKALSFESTC